MARSLGTIKVSDKWTWREVPWLLANVASELRLCRELLTQINDRAEPSLKDYFRKACAEDRIRAGMNTAAADGHRRGAR